MWQVDFIQGPRSGDRVTLPRNGVVICGRGRQCDLTCADPFVSKRHFQFSIRDDRLTLLDTNSKHGTFVNHVRKDQVDLHDGDFVRFGNTTVRIRQTLDIDLLIKIDNLASEFEADWSPKTAVNFASYLAHVEAPYRQLLLDPLLEVDVELRLKAGQPVRAEDYAELGEFAVGKVRQLLNGAREGDTC